jgi:hypothetical protein
MHQGKDKRMKGTKPATDRKRDRRKRSIKIATWNVQAKASHLGDIEIIASDMRNRGISICCIQETQNSSDASILLEHNDYIIFLGRQEDNNGGLAFYMTNEWKDRLYSIRKITERIATATFKYNVNGKDKYLTIMNVYGYTQMRSKDEPQLVQQFYKEPEEAYDYERRSTDIIMIAGDFNAKLGRRELGEETIMGNYGIGKRNTNGEELAEFLVKTGIYPANTHFKHRKMQIATWHGGRPAAKSRKPLERRNQPGLHNQIDYMLVTRRNIRLVTNCRAIVPHVFQHRSDHSMVEMVIEVGALYKMTARKRNGIDKRCMTALQDPTFKERYQMEVARRLERIPQVLHAGSIQHNKRGREGGSGSSAASSRSTYQRPCKVYGG